LATIEKALGFEHYHGIAKKPAGPRLAGLNALPQQVPRPRKPAARRLMQKIFPAAYSGVYLRFCASD
jgi:hypothetical protein